MTVVEARKALRLSNDKHDDELATLIAAAKIDLETAGVYEPTETDALYEMAITNYLRGYFSVDSPVADRCREIYADIKSSMKLTGRCTHHE